MGEEQNCNYWKTLCSPLLSFPIEENELLYSKVLHEAASLLQKGETVAIPTETVYGLAANALNADAVSKIFRAKRRPQDNPLIIHVSSLEMLEKLYPEKAPDELYTGVYSEAIQRYWPGPLTILLPRSPLVPDGVTAGQATMAVRMPSHPVARRLIELCGFPLAAPSANSSGLPSPTLAAHVMADLSGRIPMVVDGGPCCGGVESTVLDALRRPPAILRPGGVTWEQLRRLPGLELLQVYKRDFSDSKMEAAPTTPGMKYRHYSPAAAVILLDVAQAAAAAAAAAVGTGSEENKDSNNNSSNPRALCTDGVVSDEVAAALRASLARARDATLRELVAEAKADAADGSFSIAVLSTTSREPPSSRYDAIITYEERSCSGSGSGSGSRCPGEGDPEGGRGGDEMAARGPRILWFFLGDLTRPDEVARTLFSSLRAADETGVKAIVVEGIPEWGSGLAVMNRVGKAASRVVVAK